MSLVTHIYVITSLEVVSGLLVPLQTSHAVGKRKICCALSRNGIFFSAECTQYQLGLREIAMWRFLRIHFFSTTIIHLPLILKVKGRSREEVLLWASALSKFNYCEWTHQMKALIYLTVKPQNVTLVHDLVALYARSGSNCTITRWIVVGLDDP